MRWSGFIALLALGASCSKNAPGPAREPGPEAKHGPAPAVTATAPAPAPFEVHVTAWRWVCEVAYPDGVTDTDLHVPVGRPVRMVVTTKDVEHEIRIPDANVDVRAEPKVTRTLDVRFERPGQLAWTCPVDTPPGKPGYTTHAVFVDTPAELAAYFAPFEADLHPKTPADLVALGRKLYTNKGCVACHSIDGTPRVGATLLGMFGSTITFDNGTQRTLDAQAIRDALRAPASFVRRPYPPSMPSYEGQLTPVQLDALTAFVRSLAAPARPAPATAPVPGSPRAGG